MKRRRLCLIKVVGELKSTTSERQPIYFSLSSLNRFDQNFGILRFDKIYSQVYVFFLVFKD